MGRPRKENGRWSVGPVQTQAAAAMASDLTVVIINKCWSLAGRENARMFGGATRVRMINDPSIECILSPNPPIPASCVVCPRLAATSRRSPASTLGFALNWIGLPASPPTSRPPSPHPIHPLFHRPVVVGGNRGNRQHRGDGMIRLADCYSRSFTHIE